MGSCTLRQNLHWWLVHFAKAQDNFYDFFVWLYLWLKKIKDLSNCCESEMFWWMTRTDGHTQRRAEKRSRRLTYSKLCVFFFFFSWSAEWPHGDTFDSCCDVSLILQWNQKPCVILMWELSNGPRIHWGDDTTKTHAHTHTHTHTLTKRKFKRLTLAWRKGTSLTALHKVQKNGESIVCTNTDVVTDISPGITVA